MALIAAGINFKCFSLSSALSFCYQNSYYSPSIIFLPSKWLSQRIFSGQFQVCSYPAFSCFKPICPLGSVWQYLQTFLRVTTGEWGATGIKQVESRDIAQHLTMHRTAFHSKELGSPKCQSCQSWETLVKTRPGCPPIANIKILSIH